MKVEVNAVGFIGAGEYAEKISRGAGSSAVLRALRLWSLRDHDLFRVEESAQHVGGDSRHVIVASGMHQRCRPGDRTDREHRAAARRREDADVGPHLAVLLGVERVRSRDELLDREQATYADPLRGRDHDSVGRRAEDGIPAIDLESRGAAAAQAEIADMRIVGNAGKY